MIKIGITHGDINGISYEIMLKAFSDIRVTELFTPVIYGSSKVAAYYRKSMEVQPVNLHVIDRAEEAAPNKINIINCVGDDIKVELGKLTAESGNAALSSLKRALDDANRGLIDALLTAPAAIHEVPVDNIKYSSQTAFLEACLGKENQALSMLVKDNLRIALATGNIPLSDVSSQLTTDLIRRKLIDLQESLVRDFAITSPRIAVLSLNPNAGLDTPGKEENEWIIPAMEKASKEGVCCFGPYASDEFFGSGHFVKFDGILAMYYDQGLIPFKTLSMEEGVCFTAGMPIVQTATNQNPSFEIAGQNIASETAFLNALYLAVDVCRNRQIDAEINANPLRKQFFDKGSDNEKLDLTADN